MPSAPELDPVAIRKALVVHREKGTPWDIAWRDATGYRYQASDDGSLYKFMHDNFRAAYYNDRTSKGRCLVPERDVSSAIVTGLLRRPADNPSKRDRCRSGDGCDRLAVRGTFDKSFCEHHAAELDRLAIKLTNARKRADPRSGGNTSLFTHTAAA